MARHYSIVKDASYDLAHGKEALLLIEQVRKGISSNEFYTSVLTKLSFTLSEWSHYLHLSERTMQRYRAEEKSFEPLHSEKILELTMLYNYGVAVFGNKENFDIWLTTKSVALGGVPPKEFLDTSYGIQMIKDELTRIEHGVLA